MKEKENSFNFKTLVDEAYSALQEKRGREELSAEEFEELVQHKVLDATRWSPLVLLEGKIKAKSKVHFGNEAIEQWNFIKKVIIEGDDGPREAPLISENALRGLISHVLREFSCNAGLLRRRDDTKEIECGFYKGVGRFECGSCLKCGLLGFMDVESGLNAPHKVAIRSFIPVRSRIIRERMNAIDPILGASVRKEIVSKRLEALKEGESELGTMPSLYTMEFIAPGSEFPIEVMMRDVAVAEVAVFMLAFEKVLSLVGVGRHKQGVFSTWIDEPKNWRILYYRSLHEISPEVYEGKDLVDAIDKLRKVAHMAIEKKFFVKYELPSWLKGGG